MRAGRDFDFTATVLAVGECDGVAKPGHWLAGVRRDIEAQRPNRTAMTISSDGSFIVYSVIEENPGLRERLWASSS
jgi:hypothetical protein